MQLDAVREGDGKLNMTKREIKLDMQTVKMLQKTAGKKRVRRSLWKLSAARVFSFFLFHPHYRLTSVILEFAELSKSYFQSY